MSARPRGRGRPPKAIQAKEPADGGPFCECGGCASCREYARFLMRDQLAWFNKFRKYVREPEPRRRISPTASWQE